MFAQLRAALEGLVIPVDAKAIAEVCALRDQLDARLAAALGSFEAAGGHEADGAVTVAAWLRHRTGADHTTAHRHALRARKLAALPVTRQAFLDGRLSAGQVGVILAHVRAAHLERFAAHEPELVPLLADLPVDHLARAMAEWRARADALDDAAPPPERPNEVRLARTIDGRGELHGSVDADLHALLEAGFRVADPRDRERSLAERRADALATVFQHFLDHQHVVVGGRHRPHLNVVVSPDRLGDARYLDTDQPVSPAQLGVLRCDSALHRLLTDGRGAVLDYGRATRTWPADLYNAIAVRDQGCRFPGCDRPASWCDVHHVLEWDADGGPTRIDNGAMLCRRHHRLLHGTKGFGARVLPDATFEVTFPDGHTETSRPRITTRCTRPPGERPPGERPPPRERAPAGRQ